MSPIEKILVDREEAAELLSMSVTSFKQYVQPHLPPVRKGRMRRYRVKDLEAWASENRDNEPAERAA